MTQAGQKAPGFELPSTEGRIRLEDLRGRKVLLLFYTEDRTPGCTQQLTSFKGEFQAVVDAGARLVAISGDSLASHRDFCAVQGGFPFPLCSDEGLEVARLYGVVAADGYHSQRAAFVLDEEGVVTLSIPWYQPGNVAQFLSVFQALGALPEDA